MSLSHITRLGINKILIARCRTAACLTRCKATSAQGALKEETQNLDIRQDQKFGAVLPNQPNDERGSCHPEIDLSFENCREAYKSKTTAELIRSLFVLKLCSFDTLVQYNKQLMRLSRKVLGQRLFEYFMRGTFYGQFVAGKDENDIKPSIEHMRRFGVKSILDYSAEKDLSNEEAKKAEMEGCVPADETPGEYPGSADVRYRAHEEFGDRREHVTSARTYFYEDEAKCDECMEVFMRSIDAVSGSTGSTGFAAIKLTALGRPQFLLQMSEILVQLRILFEIFAGRDDCGLMRTTIAKDAFKKRVQELGIQITADERRMWFSILDRTGDGEIDLLDWHNLLDVKMKLVKVLQMRNVAEGENKPLVAPMNEEEIEQLENMLRRINTVAEYAKSKDVRLMVDAEQTYFQPAISRFTMEMMRKFNTEKAIVFNTYQCYLKSALDNIRVDLALSRREGFYFGAKLVRGAYMEQERLRAKSVGYPDPINPGYEATTEMYEKVMDEVLLEIKKRPLGEIGIMLATHNEGSVRSAIQKMRSNNIMPRDKVICFGQLLGMCDQVSFALGQAGYSVYKYVPFGPVDEVIPYLSRRALENRGLLAKVVKSMQTASDSTGCQAGYSVYKYVPFGPVDEVIPYLSRRALENRGLLAKVQKERRLMREELKRRYKNGKLIYDPLVHPVTPPI